MAAWIDEEAPRPRVDVLEGDPGGDHRTDTLTVQIISVLVGPGFGVTLEVHGLDELRVLIEHGAQRGYDTARRKYVE